MFGQVIIMRYQSVWFETQMSDELINLIENESKYYDNILAPGTVGAGDVTSVRDSQVSWINGNHWIVGMCYHYVLKANKENFNYDINGFDGDKMQYTSYAEGEYYNWHTDVDVFVDTENNQDIRKLSIIVQLSDPEDYTGGEVQLMNGESETYFLPKTKGTIIVFDSRTRHRVRKIYSGNRKSLVGWVVGPRWK